MIKLALSLAVVIALGLGFASRAHAQGPEIQINELQCSGNPERVVIENVGDAVQGFAGWELQSDPPDKEVFGLTVLGGLAPGASISIQSGPAAGGVFKWGVEFIFRDDDPADYARIVDDTGKIVHQVNCAEATPTPTPVPTSTPEPGPAIVPNGGGPPPVAGSTLWSALLVLGGGSMAILGGIVVTASRFLRRSRPADAATSPAEPAPAPRPATRRTGPNTLGTRRSSAMLGLTVAVLVTAVVLVAIRRRAG